MAKWEYGVVRAGTLGDDVVVIQINDVVQDFGNHPIGPYRILNEMGGEGWELVTILEVIPPSPSAVAPRGVWDFILKRPK